MSGACRPKEVKQDRKAVETWDNRVLASSHHAIMDAVPRNPKDWDATARAYHRAVRREMRKRGLL